MLRFLAGRAEVPVTMRRFPAALGDGKAREMEFVFQEKECGGVLRAQGRTVEEELDPGDAINIRGAGAEGDGARERGGGRRSGKGDGGAGAAAQAEGGVHDRVIVAGHRAIEVGVAAGPLQTGRWSGIQAGIDWSVVIAGDLVIEVGVAEKFIWRPHLAGRTR
jgi:hypothetical protein